MKPFFWRRCQGSAAFRLRDRLYHADRRSGGGKAGCTKDTPYEDQLRGQPEKNGGALSGGSARKPASMAQEGDERQEGQY